MSEELNINLDELKVREIIAIEDALGESIDTAFAAGKPKGRVLQAIGLVMKQREDPNFTLEDAGELVVKLGDAPVPPTDASD